MRTGFLVSCLAVTVAVVGCSSGPDGSGDIDSGGGGNDSGSALGDSGGPIGDSGSGQQDGNGPAPDSGKPPAPDSGPPVQSGIQQHCVDQINAYRKTLSLPPLARVSSKEACADGEAKSDGLSNKPHGAFPSCGEFAQNECPGWPSANMQTSLDGCLAQMWAEGPGADFSQHGHYINMSSQQYTKVFCGFYDLGNGKFWSVQDFQ